MTTFPSQDSFVRGEITPRLHARAGLDLYRSSLAVCENFITLPHGGLRKRSGTYFAGETKGSGFERPIPFIFSEEQAYMLFFGQSYFRVYAYGGPVLNGSAVVEVATDYTVDDVQELQFQQSGDVLYLTHPGHPPRKITRSSNTNWSITTLSYFDGPFGLENSETAVKVYVSGAGGSISITSTAPVFTAGMVGQLIKVQVETFGWWQPWEPGQLLKSALVTGETDVNGTLRRYDGNVYAAIQPSPPSYSGGDVKIITGATPPVHLKGSEWDGPNTTEIVGQNNDDQNITEVRGILWNYKHSGFGVGVITSVSVDGLTAYADAVTEFPDQVIGVDSKTYRWSIGGFGGDAGYPRAVAIFDERLGYGQKYSVYASKTFDFRSFRTGADADDALSFSLAGSNDITWLLDADGFLLVGTIAGVRTLSGGGQDEKLTPSSFKNKGSPTKRCSSIQPIKAGSTIVYVGFDRKSVVEMNYSLERNGYSTTPISLISEHIPKQGISSICYQAEPDAIFWMGMDNGQLAGMTYEADQNVRGWHRHRVGGKFGNYGWGVIEWAATTPGQDGADDTWLIVKRTINGVTKRHIEVLQPPFEYGSVDDAFMVDSGLTYSGAPVSSVGGLVHLEGERVSVLADGIVYKDLIVSLGSVELPSGVTASKWHVGLPYNAVAETLELDVGGRDGSVTGRRKRVNSVILSVLETANIYVRSASRDSFNLSKAGRNTIVPESSKVALFTGNLDAVHLEDTWEGQGRLRIEAPDPVPCTVRAIIPGFDSEGS